MMANTLVHQAGAIVYRIHHARVDVLIVRAKKTPKQWIFPKGHIEPAEKPEAAALREAREEAGVIGRAVKPLKPLLEFDSAGERVRVQYFLVKSLGEAPPSERREKQWVSPDEALQMLTHENARRLLRSTLLDMQKERR